MKEKMFTIKRPVDIKNINNQTIPNMLYAVMASKGEYIKFIDEPSDDLIKVALRINGLNIRFVPEEKKTRELCELAAIHGAPENILSIVDEDIKNIIEVVKFLKSKRRSKGNISINGELCNLSNRVTTEVIYDIPEFVRIWSANGYSLENNSTSICVKDGNVINLSSYIRNLPNETDFTPKYKLEDLYLDGKIISKAAEKFVYLEHSNILKLKEEDLNMQIITSHVKSPHFDENKIEEFFKTFSLASAEKYCIVLASNYRSREKMIRVAAKYFDILPSSVIKSLRLITPAFVEEFVHSTEDAKMYAKIISEYRLYRTNNYSMLFSPKCVEFSKEDVLSMYKSIPVVYAHTSEDVRREIAASKNMNPVMEYISSLSDYSNIYKEVYINLDYYEDNEVVKIYKALLTRRGVYGTSYLVDPWIKKNSVRLRKVGCIK